MKVRAIHSYVTIMVTLALISLGVQDWNAILPTDLSAFRNAFDPITGFIVLLLLGFFSESVTLPRTEGRKHFVHHLLTPSFGASAVWPDPYRSLHGDYRCLGRILDTPKGGAPGLL